MNRGEKLDNGVAQELQSLVVSDGGLGFLLGPKARHDVDKRVDTALTRVHVMDASVSVFRLANSAVCQRVACVVRICPKVLSVTWMRQRCVKDIILF